ncbi:hypothetical protein NDU88_000831 [Pleurodeles waltl]|uniref:Uncharacterized protein n=1 Tax=Pleurodeles waltl TaxID=8319 RepID=A0AAV7VY33_PLEWA|nr:hypothetical protein NDU88_000831 [Pleurodeles waltl]
MLRGCGGYLRTRQLQPGQRKQKSPYRGLSSSKDRVPRNASDRKRRDPRREDTPRELLKGVDRSLCGRQPCPNQRRGEDRGYDPRARQTDGRGRGTRTGWPGRPRKVVVDLATRRLRGPISDRSVAQRGALVPRDKQPHPQGQRRKSDGDPRGHGE